MTKSEFQPRIVGFLCNWCSYAGADLAGVSRIQYPPTLRIVRVMCSGRVDPAFILEAFKSGADGVLIAGCHPGDCHYLSGNYKAQRRFFMLERLLEQLGLEPERLRLDWVSASEGDRFATVIKDITKEIKETWTESLEGWRQKPCLRTKKARKRRPNSRRLSDSPKWIPSSNTK